jgi:transposase-like protein
MARKKEKKEMDNIDQLIDNIDQLLDNIDFRGLTKDEIVGQDGLVWRLTEKIIQRVLEAKMTGHLGYEKNSDTGDNSGNSRNGHTGKQSCLKSKTRKLKSPKS